jgi:YihY family inner membrane protein
MERLDRFVARLDAFQQRHGVLALPAAVFKKFSDDRGGYLAALISYYGAFSLFPLLLVMVTILGWILQGNERLADQIVQSVLGNFPVIGDQIHIHALKGRGVAAAIGLVVAIWAGLAVTRTAQVAMNTVWGVPRAEQPNLWISLARGLILLAVLGGLVLATTVLAGFGLVADSSTGFKLLGVTGSLMLNVGFFLLAFQVLTTKPLAWRDLVPGAVVGAVGWTALQLLGNFIVARRIATMENVYGSFAFVIVLLVWISLLAQIFLLAAEVNAVLKERRWPRSFRDPPGSGGS